MRRQHLSRKEIFRTAEAKADNKSLLSFLKAIPDPRKEKNRKYPLEYILIVVLFGFSCGCTTVVAACVESKYIRKALKRFFGIEKIPSHDTCSRVLRMLNPVYLNYALWSWAGLLTEGEQSHICYDGKAVRAAARNKGKSGKEYSTYIMNVFNASFGVFLGQKMVGKKKSEISVLPTVIEKTDIEESTVTIDAMGTHPNIISQILEQNGSFMLPAKSNQKKLMRNISDIILDAENKDKETTVDGLKRVQIGTYSESGHGRDETRQISLVHVSDSSAFSEKAWKAVKTVIKIKRTSVDRKTKKTTEQEVYYITNTTPTCEEANKVIRNHWSCEVAHYILDGERFMEDRCNARNSHAIENLAALRKFAFNLHRILEIRNGQGNEVFKAERFLAHNIKVFKHLLEEPTPRISA